MIGAIVILAVLFLVPAALVLGFALMRRNRPAFPADDPMDFTSMGPPFG